VVRAWAARNVKRPRRYDADVLRCGGTSVNMAYSSCSCGGKLAISG